MYVFPPKLKSKKYKMFAWGAQRSYNEVGDEWQFYTEGDSPMKNKENRFGLKRPPCSECWTSSLNIDVWGNMATVSAGDRWHFWGAHMSACLGSLWKGAADLHKEHPDAETTTESVIKQLLEAIVNLSKLTTLKYSWDTFGRNINAFVWCGIQAATGISPTFGRCISYTTHTSVWAGAGSTMQQVAYGRHQLFDAFKAITTMMRSRV